MINDTFRNVTLGVLLWGVTNVTNATNLCDPGCQWRIDFPDGGKIEALESMTFTFGAGGVLDLGTAGTVNVNPQPDSLDFSSGGTLTLAAGESISFGPGGELVIGQSGNLDYTSLGIQSSGSGSLSADSIVIEPLEVSGGLSFSLQATTFFLKGAIGLDSDSLVSIVGDTIQLDAATHTPDDCQDVGGAVISARPFTNLQLDNVVCTLPNELTIGLFDGTISGDLPPVIDTTPGTVDVSLVGADLTTSNDLTLSVDDIATVAPDSQGSDFQIGNITTVVTDLSLLAGQSLVTADGTACVVENTVCVTETGEEFVLDGQGALVPKQSAALSETASSGNAASMNAGYLFAIGLFLSGMRLRPRRRQCA